MATAAGSTTAREPAVAAPATAVPDAIDPEPELELGGGGSAVEVLQMQINRHLGFMGRHLLITDGRFGPLTQTALTAVLRALRVRRSGTGVDADTWAALDGPPPDVPGRASRGGTGPEYARALSDGLLDITLSHGFDESGGDARRSASCVAASSRSAASRPTPTARCSRSPPRAARPSPRARCSSAPAPTTSRSTS